MTVNGQAAMQISSLLTEEKLQLNVVAAAWGAGAGGGAGGHGPSLEVGCTSEYVLRARVCFGGEDIAEPMTSAGGNDTAWSAAGRNIHLWSAADPTLPSPLPCYCPLTAEWSAAAPNGAVLWSDPATSWIEAVRRQALSLSSRSVCSLLFCRYSWLSPD